MRIVIEATSLTQPPKTGVGFYCDRLFSAAARLDTTKHYQATVFAGQKLDPLWNSISNMKPVNVRFPRKLYNLLLRTPFALPIDVLAGIKPDIFVFPAFARWPLARTKRSILVIHDISYIEFPSVIKTSHFRAYLAWIVPRSLKRSTAVVAISESTKRGLIKHHGTPAEKVTVITPAVDHDVYKPAPQAEIDRVKATYGISGDYILYFGTLEPRKNIVGVIEAYLGLPEALQNKYKLVLAGGKGWGSTAIEQAAAKIKTDRLVRTGYIKDSDCAALHSGASVFVFPSLYEGWGMPPLEAMACGTPVITANNSSLPEVVGDAGILVEATDTLEIAKSMERVLTDKKLAASMRTKGIARAQLFSWDQSARQLIALFDKIGAL